MAITDTYLQYGVPSDKAEKYDMLGIPVTTFRNTSNKNLIDKYGLDKHEVAFVKNCIQRKPIDELTILRLLEKNNYTCCICKGVKSDAYIIHHIEEYSVSQDNEYYNLAVLCPNDHDLVHREGVRLTNTISKEQLIKAKEKWEKQVQELNVERASKNGELYDIDFVNIPRILELCLECYGKIPDNRYTNLLKGNQVITDSGFINDEFLNIKFPERKSPFDFYLGLEGAVALRAYIFEIFKDILKQVDFVDLDSLLQKSVIKTNNIAGKFCYYVGGVYGKSPKFPVTASSPLTHIYFRRKPFFVEWTLHPQYLTSSTAKLRLSKRTQYIIYGRIKGIGEKEIKGQKFIYLDIRPYVFGSPIELKNRTPIIHYIKDPTNYDSYFEDDEN
ncbi:MAG: HNH endonuclease [Bacteroidales bacterium]|nr:HNH endonuclease [Bacteroidales bacterium]